MLKIKKKKKIVVTMRNTVRTVSSVLISDFYRVNTNKINELRKESKKKRIFIRIIRNTLVKKIIENTQFQCLNQYLKNSNLIAFSNQNPEKIIKFFKNFYENGNSFKIKTVSFNGKILSPSKIRLLSRLPNRITAIARFLFVLKQLSLGNLIALLVQIQKNK